ncbi:unnamed protein product [Caretta caretta]
MHPRWRRRAQARPPDAHAPCGPAGVGVRMHARRSRWLSKGIVSAPPPIGMRATRSRLRRLRADDNPHFASLYAEVKCSADAVSVEESLLPTRGRKMNYDNIGEYDRRNVFIPFLDHVISELQRQVIDCSSRFLAQFLVPDKLHVLENENTVMALNDAYKVDLSNLDNFKAELQRWPEKWIDIPRDEQPNSILSTLQELMPASYPDLNIALSVGPPCQSVLL